MVDFIPPLNRVEARLGLDSSDSLETVDTVQIDGALLRFLISRLASGFAMDARAYRTDNDLTAELDWSETPTASAHFAEQGYLRGLTATPRNFDEEWYLATYPDAQIAVAEGQYQDALAHYMAVGYSELRAPNALAVEELRMWRRILRQPKPEPAVHLRPLVPQHKTG